MYNYALTPYELFLFPRTAEVRPATGYQPPAWLRFDERKEHAHREHPHLTEPGSLAGMTPSFYSAATTPVVLPADFSPGYGAASDLCWSAAERHPVPVPHGADNLRASDEALRQRIF